MKTPEQMADEWANNRCPVQGPGCIGLVLKDDVWCMCKDTFLAGYQAAKEEYKVAIDTYNNVAKQMLNESVRIMSSEEMKDE